MLELVKIPDPAMCLKNIPMNYPEACGKDYDCNRAVREPQDTDRRSGRVWLWDDYLRKNLYWSL